MELPKSTETIKNIPVGRYFPFAPIHVSQPFYMMAWKKPVSEPLTAAQRICKLSSTEVKTGDGVVIPISKYARCEMLLAKDCSKSRFAVIVKGIEGTTRKVTY